MARRNQRTLPPVEWITGLISAAIVLGTIGFLASEAVRQGDQEPALTVAVLDVHETTGSFVVDVEVRNGSRGAAAGVHLAGSATTGDGQQVQAQARLDYVPGFSTGRASLVFAADPGRAPTVRIVGYARP